MSDRIQMPVRIYQNMKDLLTMHLVLRTSKAMYDFQKECAYTNLITHATLKQDVGMQLCM